MKVTLEVPDIVVERAKARGISVERYLQDRLDAEARYAPERARRKLTKEEAQDLVRRLSQFAHKTPPMPGETFSREMIYQDHD